MELSKRNKNRVPSAVLPTFAKAPSTEVINPSSSDAPYSPGCKEKLAVMMEHPVPSFTLQIVTLYALFGYDVRLAFFGKAADPVFEVLSTIAFFSFLLELLINMWVKSTCTRCRVSGYLVSLYFVCDILATISLVPEIPWLYSGILNSLSGLNLSYSSKSNSLTTARISRVARTGSRIGRILRMIRFLRLLKLYLQVVRFLKTRPELQSRSLIPKESKVGATLSQRTTNRVIVCVLFVLLIFPLFEVDTQDLSRDYAAQLMHDYNTLRPPLWTLTATMLLNLLTIADLPLVFMRVVPVAGTNLTDPMLDLSDSYSSLRTFPYGDELQQLDLKTDNGDGTTTETHMWFNTKSFSTVEAIDSMLLTVFATCMLAIGSFTFSNDNQRLVLHPIENMVSIVEQMARDPLKEFNSSDNTGLYEAKVLENTVKKIGSLLRVGFGRQGAFIVTEHMRGGERFDLLTTTPGTSVLGIFAYCQIQNFEKVVQVLEKEVVVLVNHLAKIVHDKAISWSGYPIGNLGGAFLLFWKLQTREKDDVHSPTSPGGDDERDLAGSLDKLSMAEVNMHADKALISILKMITDINRQKVISDYQQHSRIKQFLPGYRVRLNFSLHPGWVVEGAIGSGHKLDAAYVGEAVQTVSDVATLCPRYGIPVLITGAMHSLLSPEAQMHCRLIDSVKIRSSAGRTSHPITLYTYDVWDPKVSRRLPMSHFAEVWDKEDTWQTDHKIVPANTRRISMFGGAPIIEHKVERGLYDRTIFDHDSDLLALRAHVSDEFRAQFAEAVDMYLEGHWAKAKEALERCVKNTPLVGGDPPSKELLTFMAKLDYKAPEGWDACRLVQLL